MITAQSEQFLCLPVKKKWLWLVLNDRTAGDLSISYFKTLPNTAREEVVPLADTLLCDVLSQPCLTEGFLGAQLFLALDGKGKAW